MNQCEETEEGVHPFETPLCGQHDNQTKAQRLGSLESLSSDLKKNVTISDDSSDDGISLGRKDSSKYRRVSSKRTKTFNRIAFKENPDHKSSFRPVSAPLRPDFSESLFSHPLKDVAAGDRYSVLSSDSGLDPGESSSSYLKKDSFQSSDSRCVSRKEKAHSYDIDIDFKKKCMLAMNQCEETEEGVHPSETPLCGQHDNQTKAQSWLDFSESLFSHPLMDVATADRYSVLSSDSGLGSLESLSSDLKKDSFRSSDRRCVSLKEKTRSYQHDIDFKKNPDHKCALRTASAPLRLNFSESLFSHPLKKVAAADRDSVLSSDSGISLERKDSSGFSCESSKKEKEKTTPPTTQEFVVGSSAGIET